MQGAFPEQTPPTQSEVSSREGQLLPPGPPDPRPCPCAMAPDHPLLCVPGK